MDASTGTLIMILCYVFGSGLIIMEAFMPGFGVAGIAGVILEIAAVILTNKFFGLAWSLIGTFLVLLFVGVAIFISYRSAIFLRLRRPPLKRSKMTEMAMKKTTVPMITLVSCVGAPTRFSLLPP